MKAAECAPIDRNHDTQKDEKDTEKQLFSFKSLQVRDSDAILGGISAFHSSSNEKGTDESQSQQHSPSMASEGKISTSTKFVNKYDDKQSSLEGNWTLYCTTEPDSYGRSEANEIWASVQEMHYTMAELFPIAPLTHKKDNGTIAVYCYTPDYADKVHILRVARTLREMINYPFVMYYHKRVGKLTSFYMHTPDDEFYVNVEGSWTLEELE